MMRAWVYVLLVLLTPEQARSHRADRVLVFKSVEARVVSVGDTFAVQYRIFNVGQSPIFDISLSDGNWHRNFSRVVGTPQASWKQIAAGANLSHVCIVRATHTGTFAPDAAVLTYKVDPSLRQLQAVKSNGGAQLAVVEAESVEALTQAQAAWVRFCAATACTVWVPFAAWLFARRASTLAARTIEAPPSHHTPAQ